MKLLKILPLIFIFLSPGATAQPQSQTKAEPGPEHLFRSGTEGYNTFRIPALIRTSRGTLLAFAEGRKNSSSDTGDIDLVMKRSEDGGKTWSSLAVIWDDGNNVCGNPAPVQDRKSGKIFLLSTWNLGSDREADIIKQRSRDTRRIFVIESADDGKTWLVPAEITSTVKQDNWTWYATGPCHGIQVARGAYAGRMIIPCDHIEAVTERYFSHIIYSDDSGKTWTLGGSTRQDQVNECSVAELSSGRLMLNMRNYDRTQKSRKVALSNDGGSSWSDIRPDPALIEPICQGSLLSDRPGDRRIQRLLFLNPASESARRNMTLRISYDEGSTWKISAPIWEGPSAYSDMALLSKNRLGLLYEAGVKSPYEVIVFGTMDLRRLEKE
ncbi:MAG: glycoside hydrolase [Bacteroidales bacterium]|nr:glycoside hydrolase [Bacteroidales bacterium]